ncbi:MAG: alanine racemase [Variovorax sp.]|nr:MAG: alanine racemase [Variovorax sp.]
MARPSRARIDLKALRHNYELARTLHGARVLAVLKADAYGHGATRCAQALAGHADGFAVAFLDEAMALRAAGVEGPILVLEGLFHADELREARAHALWTVVHQESQLRMIEDEAVPSGAQPMQVWLKADSGMRRAGFALPALAEAHARLQRSGKVGDIVLMTHFARADEPAEPSTLQQILAFNESTASLAGARSLCNSAGVLGWPNAYGDWARPGILLYGADPMPRRHVGLRPVMTLESEVFAERLLQPGDALGYGGGFVAEEPMRIGLVAIGYADGYPRNAPAGTPVAVDGHAARLVGRVSMDMLTVDLSDLPGAGIGSKVELWGANVDVNVVARSAGTIAYELLCNVKRVARSFLD